jgi:hypothetical protein
MSETETKDVVDALIEFAELQASRGEAGYALILHARDEITRLRSLSTASGGETSEILPIGTPVEKIRGYLWPGTVVAAFRTLSGELRYVVECTVPDVAGALHIYAPAQIERTKATGREAGNG